MALSSFSSSAGFGLATSDSIQIGCILKQGPALMLTMMVTTMTMVAVSGEWGKLTPRRFQSSFASAACTGCSGFQGATSRNMSQEVEQSHLVPEARKP